MSPSVSLYHAANAIDLRFLVEHRAFHRITSDWISGSMLTMPMG